MPESKEGSRINPEVPNITRTVGAVIIQDNKVLLVKHLPGERLEGLYGLPAGALQDGESNIDALKRKVEAETGIVLQDEEVSEFQDNMFEAELDTDEGKRKFSLQTYKALNFSGELRAAKHEQPVWVDIDKLDELPLLPNTKTAIINALK